MIYAEQGQKNLVNQSLCLSDKLSRQNAITIITRGLVIPLVFAMAVAIEDACGWVNWLLAVNRHEADAPAWIRDLPGVGNWLAKRWNLALCKPIALDELPDLSSEQRLGSLSRWGAGL